MFKVDQSANRICKLDQKSFSDLNLGERTHLQEWLAGMPDALGEELLIIQKEFAGFADTRERLDLLALDKHGQLVIIENKLDDTGRDVVWQAVKYAAYCSNLTKTQIIDIFQQYLDGQRADTIAEETIREFLDEETLDEIVLNGGNDQRIMFVAGNFRKEVTAAVLWLIGHDIRVQCFRVVPYSLGEELLIDLKQIIPTPEAADYMIGMATKEKDERSTEDAQRRSHQLRLEFWGQALDQFRLQGITRYQNISPSKDHWLNCATGLSGCAYSLIFLQHEARVELGFQRADRADNKWIFDKLYARRDELEEKFGADLEWIRNDEKKSSKIQLSQSYDSYNRDAWSDIIDWLGQHFRRFEGTFSEPLNQLDPELKARASS